MAKKNNPSVKPAPQRQIVAFSWNESKAGEITPVQYVNGEWIAEKSVPFGGTINIIRRLYLSLGQSQKLPAMGQFQIILKIYGQDVTVRGAVVNGIPRIGTAFIP